MNRFTKRKIYAAILALCTTNTYAQTVIVDKSNTNDPITVSKPETTVVGSNNTSDKAGQTTVGSGNTNTAYYGSNIFGLNNTNSAMDSTIVGNYNSISSTATMAQGLVFGNYNNITNNTEFSYSMLFGFGLSDNGFSNCIAFGSSSTSSGCTTSNQFSVGGLTIGNVANGVLDSDAVNLGQVKSMISAGGSGGSTDLSGIQSMLDAHTSLISTTMTKVGTLEGSLATANMNINSLQAQVNAIPSTGGGTDTTALQGQVDNHTGQISNLQTQSNANTAAIVGQAGQIATVAAQTDQNTADIATHTGQISSLQTGLAQTNTRVAAVEVQTNKNTADIAVQAGQITGLQTGLAQTNTKVASVEAQTDKNTNAIAVQSEQITTIQGDVGSLQTGLAATNDQVARNTDGIKQLDSKVTGLENRIDRVEGMAKSYAYSAAAMGMAASGIVFDPRLSRQIGMAGSTVNGKSALAIGVAVRQGNAILNAKAVSSGAMKGASVGATWGF